jgi:DNA-binding transcriptional LysR family regulator
MNEPLDSRRLLAFTMLAGTGSFTRAAKQLSLTQSAVSHAIKALETELGCRLLDRVGKKIALTPAGEHLLGHAQTILQTMQTARDQMQRLRDWGATRLRLGGSATACQYLLPAVLREFKLRQPRCLIHIEPCDARHVLELMDTGRVDMALTLQPRRAGVHEFHPLFRDELMFIVAPFHPWARQRVAPADDAIAAENFVLYDQRSHTSWLVERYFAARRLSLRRFIEFGSMDAIKEMVKLGLGVGILAPWVARQELNSGALVAVPLGRRKLQRQWGLLVAHGRQLSLTGETFIQICRKNLRHPLATPTEAGAASLSAGGQAG